MELYPRTTEKTSTNNISAPKTGRKIIIRCFSKETFDSFREGQTWESCPSGGFWREHGYIALSGHYKYQDLITLEQTTIISDAEIATYYIWNTCFTQNSLVEEVKKVVLT